MKEKIILIGGGGHCSACVDVIEQEGRFTIAGIVDVPEKKQHNILIKSPTRRMELFNKLKRMGALFPVIQSPLAYVSPHAQIGEGTIVMHHALINAGARVGRNCIINTRALVEHDAVIEDYCHISTGAVVNGGVIIGSGSFFGSGAVSKEYTSIPSNSFIPANSLYRKSDE
jgi:sugar O-acyltransferase (sialic acid O-acetyltransferase NeuD family)